MGLYTIYNDPEVDAHIAKDCATLCEIILSRIPYAVSVVLVGGFGRGEGSVLKYGGIIQPINDYDVIVLVPSSAQKRLTDLIALKKVLSGAVKIRQVDVALFGIDELKHLPRKMAIYDLRNHAKILFGDTNVLSDIPMFGPGDILRRESRVPIFLYLGALLQAFPEIKSESHEQHSFWCAQQISKAVIGFSTAHLVLRREYAASYRERKIRALNLFCGDREMSKLIEFGYDFKLQPQYPVGIDVCRLWESAILEYKKAAFSYFCAYYNADFGNWEQILEKIKYDPWTLAIKAFAYLTRNTSYIESQRLNIVKLLLCISYKSEGNRFLEIANGELMKITDWNLQKTWPEARRQFCKISPDNVMFFEGNDKVFMGVNADYAIP